MTVRVVECAIVEGFGASGVCCERCETEMTPEVGRPIGRAAWRGSWLWWRCANGHVSAALPIPAEWVATLDRVMPNGSLRLQPPVVARAPSGTLRR